MGKCATPHIRLLTASGQRASHFFELTLDSTRNKESKSIEIMQRKHVLLETAAFLHKNSAIRSLPTFSVEQLQAASNPWGHANEFMSRNSSCTRSFPQVFLFRTAIPTSILRGKNNQTCLSTDWFTSLVQVSSSLQEYIYNSKLHLQWQAAVQWAVCTYHNIGYAKPEHCMCNIKQKENLKTNIWV